ncbi:hypothetical protein [Variovorax sp. YR216]|nr:hypothetical protein [Variovorax sp. YR216]
MMPTRRAEWPQTAQQPIIGFALGNAGLMPNLSRDGTKISRLDL